MNVHGSGTAYMPVMLLRNTVTGCCGGGLSSYINSQKDMQTTAISASFVQLINNTAGGGEYALPCCSCRCFSFEKPVTVPQTTAVLVACLPQVMVLEGHHSPFMVTALGVWACS